MELGVSAVYKFSLFQFHGRIPKILAEAMFMSSTPVYCVNHPKTETLLTCNKCGKPVCIKCVVRTPVGFRCKECLNIQQAGYYTATPMDHGIAAIAGTIAAMVGGVIAAVLGGVWVIAIFVGPAAGGVIAEITRRSIGKRRGKYIWLVGCAALILGSFLGASLFGTLSIGFGARGLVYGAISGFLNIGLWIYIILALGTVYARLKS